MDYQQETQDRLEAVKSAPTWLEVKEQRILLNRTPNLMTDDKMFRDEGYLYPTKCYQADRIKANCEFRPVRYDSGYALDFYQQRVIKQLSLENQLKLLGAITALYTDLPEEIEKVPMVDIKDCIEALNDVDKLQLCKDIAKSIGMRVIKK